jgi:hypothetical protein
MPLFATVSVVLDPSIDSADFHSEAIKGVHSTLWLQTVEAGAGAISH